MVQPQKHKLTEQERKAEIQRLTAQQKKDAKSQRVEQKKKTYSFNMFKIANGREPLSDYEREVARKLISRQDEEIRSAVDLELILSQLSKKENYIVNQKLAGYTQEEIAKELKVHQSSISRVLNDLRPFLGPKKREE